MANDSGRSDNSGGSWATGLSVAGLVAVVGGVWSVNTSIVSRAEFNARVASDNARIEIIADQIDDIRNSRFTPGDWAREEKWLREKLSHLDQRLNRCEAKLFAARGRE